MNRMFSLSWCSPHTRGWTGHRHHHCRPDQRVPRIRGDGPRSVFFNQCILPCSPHNAGMDRLQRSPEELFLGVPRIRGDGLWYSASRQCRRCVFPAYAGMDRGSLSTHPDDAECSPHTRGWTAPPSTRRRSLKVFPAYAGMDLKQQVPPCLP